MTLYSYSNHYKTTKQVYKRLKPIIAGIIEQNVNKKTYSKVYANILDNVEINIETNIWDNIWANVWDDDSQKSFKHYQLLNAFKNLS